MENEYRLNERGEILYWKWESIYSDELEKQRELRNDPEWYEGLSIIDNGDFLKTLEDVIGLLIFAYEGDVMQWYFSQCREYYKDDECFFEDETGREYTLAEVEREMAKYFE